VNVVVAILFIAWAVVALAIGVRGRPWMLSAWTVLGLVPVLVAAEEGAWQLGEWSRDVSPLPVFGAAVLVTVALERWLPPAIPAAAGSRRHRSVAVWVRAAAVVWGVALGLLGDSGLALALSAAIALVVAGAGLPGPDPRFGLHPTNE
jgi:hypothetical protein